SVWCQHAGNRLAWHRLALDADVAPAHRRSGQRARRPRLSSIRPDELSSRPGSLEGDRRRAARARPPPTTARARRGFRAGEATADADGEWPGPGAHAEPESRCGVALRRARDGSYAVGRSRARTCANRPRAGAGLVRFSRRACPWGAELSRARPRRRGLLRLAP